MGEYERYALVLDSGDSELGQAALRLLDLGLDVLYANDPYEATLLARQEASLLGAVLVPTKIGIARIDEAISGVCSQLGAGPATLVPVGLEPSEDEVAALREQGVVWCLWEPYTERDLRFVLSAAMSTAHPGDRRKSLRVPVSIETPVFMGRHRKDVMVHNLSSGGAYLATMDPFLEGSQLSVDIPLPAGRIIGKAVVVNAKTGDKPGRKDVPEGMGIAFTQLEEESVSTLQNFLRAWIRRFQI